MTENVPHQRINRLSLLCLLKQKPKPSPCLTSRSSPKHHSHAIERLKKQGFLSSQELKALYYYSYLNYIVGKIFRHRSPTQSSLSLFQDMPPTKTSWMNEDLLYVPDLKDEERTHQIYLKWKKITSKLVRARNEIKKTVDRYVMSTPAAITKLDVARLKAGIKIIQACN